MRLNVCQWMMAASVAFGLLATSSSVAQATALEPFTARYEVLRDGKSQGEALMKLERIDGERWRFSNEVRGTSGMARLSGFEMTESIELSASDSGLRPLSASASGGISLRRRSVETRFDWSANEVRWSGDVKPEHTGPAPLSARSVTPQLLNLALAQRVRSGTEPGQTLSFDMVNRGESDAVEYQVRGPETVKVPMGSREAIALHHRRSDKDREITVWVDPSLAPAPVRVLQRDDGKDSYELRLIELN